MTATAAGWLDLDQVALTAGPNVWRTDQVSVLEACAWQAGELHSDRPACVSPVLADLIRGWAGALDDPTRQRLKPWVARLARTGGDGLDPERLLLLVDWLTRSAAPSFLRAADLHTDADQLAGMAATVGWEPACADRSTCHAAAAAAARALEAAWVAATDARDAQQAAHWATRAAGASAAASAVQMALAKAVAAEAAGHLDLTDALAILAAAALYGRPVTKPVEDVTALVLRELQAAGTSLVDAAALTAALHAPPHAAQAMLRPVVRALQDGLLTDEGLLERLCTPKQEEDTDG